MQNDHSQIHNVDFAKAEATPPQIGHFCLIGDEQGGKNAIGKNAKIRSHSIIYGGNKIGDNFQTGHHVMIRENNIIGNDVSVGSYSNIEHHVTIEDGVRIHSGCFIPEYCHLKKDCWIGPKVCFTNARYPRSKRVKDELKGAIVGENAKIGANTTILPGIKIGKNVLIGAGSVITKDIPDDSVACGNPAKVVKKTSELFYEDGESVY